MEIPLPVQLFQGRRVLSKFIRHLTVIKDRRHAEARVTAIVLSSPFSSCSRLESRRFHNFNRHRNERRLQETKKAKEEALKNSSGTLTRRR